MKCKHQRKHHFKNCIRCNKDGSIRRKEKCNKLNCPRFEDTKWNKIKEWFGMNFYW